MSGVAVGATALVAAAAGARRVARDQRLFDAGGNDGDADDAVEGLVEGGADDDVGVLVDFLANPGRGFVDLEQRQVLAAGDRDQQAAGALHRGIVDQRIGDRGFGRGQRALVAGGFAGAHHRLAHFAHHGADVGEVEIDQAFLDHQVGDAGDARIEHLVGHREGVGEGGLFVGDPEQVLVRDDQQRVDHLVQLGDAGLGGAHAALAFEVERLGDDADGEDAHVARGLGDDGGCAGAGAAAHAGGDEHHVGAGEMIADFVDDFLRGGGADIGLRTGAEALGDLGAHLHDALRLRHRERLRVGVGDDEIDPLQPGGDHVVDGVAAGAADAEHGDPRLQLADIRGR